MLYETLKWPQIAPFCISSKKIPDPLPPPLKNYGMHTIKRQLRPCNIKLKIKYFKEKGYNNEDVDTAVSDFNNILLQAAEMSLTKKKSNSSKKKKKKIS